MRDAGVNNYQQLIKLTLIMVHDNKNKRNDWWKISEAISLKLSYTYVK